MGLFSLFVCWIFHLFVSTFDLFLTAHYSNEILAGEAMAFAGQYLLTTSAGRRTNVPGVVVVIADKQSADNLTPAADDLRATGTSNTLRNEYTSKIIFNFICR